MKASFENHPLLHDDVEEEQMLKLVERFVEVGAQAQACRRVKVADRVALLRAIISEIDETVLPRRIKVEADTGAATLVTVSNRRLVGVATNQGESTQSFAQDQNAMANWFITMLDSYFYGCREISFSVQSQRQVVQETSLSCSTDTLFWAAEISKQNACLKLSFLEVLREVSEITEASLLVVSSTSTPDIKGPEDLVYKLRESQRIWSDSMARFSKLKPLVPKCSFLSYSDDCSLVVVEQGDVWFAGFFPSERALEVMQKFDEAILKKTRACGQSY